MTPPADHRPTANDAQAAKDWLAAVTGPAGAALDMIYRDTAAEIERRGPACWASGRCCRFREAGHVLYVTGLEAAYCLTARGSAPSPPARPIVSLRQISDANQRGDCPYLSDNLCGVHTHKPLGCRVYFCDRSAQAWQMDLSENMLARIRAVHDSNSLVYRYGEWRAMLTLVRTAVD